MNLPTIAFLGLGAMGSRMAARLLAAGHPLRVWNRSPSAAEGLRTAGAMVAATPAEAARGAEVVISMVFDDAASRRVWLDARDGAATALAPTALALECSTLSPGWIAELAAALPAPLVDAPVTGSRPQAEAGALIFMAAGEPAAVERARPVLLAMGATVHAVGASGAGAWLKLSVNSLFATQVVAVAEQLALLRGAGLDLQAVLAVLKQMPVASPAAMGAAAMMLAGQFAPMAPIDLIGKDLAYAQAAASQPLVQLAATQERFSAASRAGWGGEHLSAVAKLYGFSSNG